MNGRGRSNEQRVIELLDQACDGRLPSAGADELHELLTLDPQHFQTCVQYLDMHAALVHFAVEPLTNDELVATIRGRHDHERRRDLRWMAAVAALCVAGVLLAGYGLFRMNEGMLAGAPAVAGRQAAEHPLTPPLAKLQEISAEAGWQGPARPTGQALFRNDRVALSQGRVVVEFPSGVQVRFQGPGVLALESDMSVRLFGGRALANVPRGAAGFTIRAGDCVIVDYGTEFLIDASVDQTAAVSVRRGQVGVGFDSQAGGDRSLVAAGSAVKLEAGSRSIFSTVYDQEAFRQFDLDMAGIAALSSKVRLVQEPRPTFPLDFVTPSREGFLLQEVARHELAKDLQVANPLGKFDVPRGTHLDSFLFHFSPTDRPTSRIQGSITFAQPILAVITDGETLGETDTLLGVAPGRENELSRGLENGNGSDTLQLSEDRRTVTFAILTAEGFTDQLRILVQGQVDR